MCVWLVHFVYSCICIISCVYNFVCMCIINVCSLVYAFVLLYVLDAHVHAWVCVVYIMFIVNDLL